MEIKDKENLLFEGNKRFINTLENTRDRLPFILYIILCCLTSVAIYRFSIDLLIYLYTICV